MKRLVCLLLTLILIIPVYAQDNLDISDGIALYIGSNNSLVKNELVKIDENEAIVPFVKNGRTFVPVRFIAEALDFKVDYAESAKAVFLLKDEFYIAFAIGGNLLHINGNDIKIDENDDTIIPIEKDGRTFLPLRALCEAVGKQVFYDRGLIIISDNANSIDAQTDKTKLDEIINKLNKLPVVGSLENLEKLVENNIDRHIYKAAPGDAGGGGFSLKQSVTADTAAPAPAPSAERTAQGDYSKTNVQVEGVDEADVVKTDGNYIYQVNGSRIIIASINPAEQMSITNIIKDDTVYFNPIEMYVDGDKLTVISNVSKKMPSIYDSAQGARIAPDIAVDSKLIMPYPVGGQSYVRCAVYNIADRSNPIRERVFEIEGSYISSRKIDDIVYMVTNKYMYYYRPLAELDGPVTPMLMDTAEEAGDYKEIPLTDVCYFPNFRECNYASISSLSINKPKEAAKVETFLGASNNIYVSKGNMYITTLNYDYNNGTQNTVIYKFSLDNGKITFLAKQSVEGNVLNQFSMDEHNGNFRIATTSYSGRDYRMSNNLFILDSAMQKRGSITGIAPNESIYSVRFVGDRGYMVTFEKVDPLFVLDLSDIDNPKILGKLKIPGYSNYLHPVDENHILGFGKDTEVYGNNAYYQGMKMALFDISDVTNPIEKHVEIIGDRGTDSDLLYNHKALLYDADKNLLAFPVTVRRVTEDKKAATQYGQFEFDGAYVYNFSKDTGFELKGKISHLTDEDYLKAGNYFDYSKKINRILYANGNLFTTSMANIQAHRLDDLTFIKSIDIPKQPNE